jgi:hypothetical protein
VFEYELFGATTKPEAMPYANFFSKPQSVDEIDADLATIALSHLKQSPEKEGTAALNCW